MAGFRRQLGACRTIGCYVGSQRPGRCYTRGSPGDFRLGGLTRRGERLGGGLTLAGDGERSKFPGKRLPHWIEFGRYGRSWLFRRLLDRCDILSRNDARGNRRPEAAAGNLAPGGGRRQAEQSSDEKTTNPCRVHSMHHDNLLAASCRMSNDRRRCRNRVRWRCRNTGARQARSREVRASKLGPRFSRKPVANSPRGVRSTG